MLHRNRKCLCTNYEVLIYVLQWAWGLLEKHSEKVGGSDVGEAWRAASFFSKPENSHGEGKSNPPNLEVKTNENDEAGFILFV